MEMSNSKNGTDEEEKNSELLPILHNSLLVNPNGYLSVSNEDTEKPFVERMNIIFAGNPLVFRLIPRVDDQENLQVENMFEWKHQPINHTVVNVELKNLLALLGDYFAHGRNKIGPSANLEDSDLEINDKKLDEVCTAIGIQWTRHQKIPSNHLLRSLSPTHKYMYDFRCMMMKENTVEEIFDSLRAKWMVRKFPCLGRWVKLMRGVLDGSSGVTAPPYFDLRFTLEGKGVRRFDGRSTELCLVYFSRDWPHSWFLNAYYQWFTFVLIAVKLEEFA